MSPFHCFFFFWIASFFSCQSFSFACDCCRIQPKGFEWLASLWRFWSSRQTKSFRFVYGRIFWIQQCCIYVWRQIETADGTTLGKSEKDKRCRDWRREIDKQRGKRRSSKSIAKRPVVFVLQVDSRARSKSRILFYYFYYYFFFHSFILHSLIACLIFHSRLLFWWIVASAPFFSCVLLGLWRCAFGDVPCASWLRQLEKRSSCWITGRKEASTVSASVWCLCASSVSAAAGRIDRVHVSGFPVC